jgi:CubicO group peptidase (beta-lactamase class C family)
VRLAEALEEVRSSFIQLHSLLIVRDGSVLVDAYVYPYDESLYHDVASVTKSVVSTLIGIAATRGELDLDAPIVSFFADREIADLNEDKERITVRDLLSMSSGLACSDWPSEQTQPQMRESPDWIRFVLDLDTVEEPGTTFSYCSPGMHLLSAILQQATGMTALEYARQELFEPLGIGDVYWPADRQGISHGWGDLAMHPRDAAKIGFLYLQGGVWDGRRILSPEWVAEATTPQVRTGRAEDYGYGWWVSPPGEEPAFFRADGDGGQRILVVPSLDLVIVTTGGRYSERLFEALATATGSLEPLPPNPTGVDRLQAVVDALALGPEPEPIPELPATARRISGRTYVFHEELFGIRSLNLDFDRSSSIATFRLDLASEPGPRLDRVGLDGVFRPSLEGRPIVARGYWDDPRTFVIEIDEGPGLRTYELRLLFHGRAVRLDVLGEVVEGSMHVAR